MKWIRFLKYFFLLAIFTSAMILSSNAGNSFIIANLRVDLPEIYNARDYRVQLMATDLPTTGDARDFTTAWLGIFLAEYNGTPGSGQFAQVGLITKKSGVKWFVYAEPGVECLVSGENPDPNHCYGNENEIVTLNTWQTVELVKYVNDDFWIARLYDDENTPYDLAKIWSASNRIYMARSDTEEGYYENTDPYITAKFYHWHPQYWHNGNWQDWPNSSSDNYNKIYTSPSTICPNNYGATINLQGDDRFWYAGTDGKQCFIVPFFPALTTHLPDEKAIDGFNNWLTHHQIQNLSNTDETIVQIHFYDTNGIYQDSTTPLQFPSKGRVTLWPTANLSNYQGTATLYSSTDVAVVAENHHIPLNVATNYTGIVPVGYGANPGWGQTATTLYVPTVKRNYYGRTTDLIITNAGPNETNITVDFYTDSGNYQDNLSCNAVAPNEQCKLKAFLSWPDLLNAKISNSNGYQLAGLVVERPESGDKRTVASYNMLANGATTLYIPVVKKNFYGYTSGIRVQNTTATDTDISITYYQDGSSNTYTSGPHTIPAQGTYTIYQDSSLPASFIGTAQINSSSQKIVADSHEAGTVLHMSNSAFQQGSTALYIPSVCRGCADWSAGIGVQNVSNSSTRVNVRYYDGTGTQVGSVQRYTLDPKRGTIIYNQIPTGGPYAVKITAAHPLVATVNMVGTNQNTDLFMSYNAPNR